MARSEAAVPRAPPVRGLRLLQPQCFAFDSLAFEAPRLVEDSTNASGPWFDKVHSLSASHALGLVGARMLASSDGGRSWSTLDWQNATETDTAIYSGASFHDLGANVTLHPGPKNVNVTAISTSSTTTFALRADGTFTRSTGPPLAITGLPRLSATRPMLDHPLRLSDGSLLGTMVTAGVGTSRSGYLSVAPWMRYHRCHSLAVIT